MMRVRKYVLFLSLLFVAGGTSGTQEFEARHIERSASFQLEK
jgi:hypothetical protein